MKKSLCVVILFLVFTVDGATADPVDTDGDGFADWYETEYGSNSLDSHSQPAAIDLNLDGLTNNIDAIVLFNWTIGNIAVIPLSPIPATPGEEFTIYLPGDVPMVLMSIPTGTFQMGSSIKEPDREEDEGPVHTVSLTRNFYMGKYEVTKVQWMAVMGTTPWAGQDYVLNDVQSPAVFVSWDMIAGPDGFMDRLNAHLQSSGQGAYQVRLPTEAEWEYSCRAGTTARFYWGGDLDYSEINQYAWWKGITDDMGEKYAHIVGQKIPNAWGLYDMSGNVWEWCQDWYALRYPSGSQTDPTGPSSGSSRVMRGGNWNYYAEGCRSAARFNFHPSSPYNYGFRVQASRRQGAGC